MGKSAAEQRKNKGWENIKPHQYRKGQSGNLSGRPKGSVSLKEYAKNMLASMTEDEREEFMHGLDKNEIWRMAEGNPESKTDVTTGGKPLYLPAELMQKNDITPEPEQNSS